MFRVRRLLTSVWLLGRLSSSWGGVLVGCRCHSSSSVLWSAGAVRWRTGGSPPPRFFVDCSWPRTSTLQQGFRVYIWRGLEPHLAVMRSRVCVPAWCLSAYGSHEAFTLVSADTEYNSTAPSRDFVDDVRVCRCCARECLCVCACVCSVVRLCACWRNYVSVGAWENEVTIDERLPQY